ncbi:MAG: hypothetical protein ABSE39_09405 [Candidatus Bathyarchaeia archaeon]|jgi:hypothetical protein
MKETKRIFALTIVVGMVITIVIADLIVDALTPMKSLAFTYRLIVNVCTVIIFALIARRVLLTHEGKKVDRINE